MANKANQYKVKPDKVRREEKFSGTNELERRIRKNEKREGKSGVSLL